ncbi:MAG: sigma-70 family RNA polymerase sigma factor [Opitutaceae bacterium]|jgi:RNA polymerase sigma-70 factor (ECF subfamily)
MHTASARAITPAKAESAAEAAYDATLVNRFNTGDESAFVEIMSRYHNRLFSLAHNLLRNAADAEEIVQDAFIRAHRALVNFRGDSSLATWLYRIALNLSRNRYWYFFRRRRQDSLSLDHSLSDDSTATFADLIPAGDNDPARDTTNNEFITLISLCMEKLDAGHREILTMRNVLDLSYDEIARSLGINVGTVKSRIARARENLRKLLAECAPEFGPESVPSDFFVIARRGGGLRAVACT